MKRFVYNKKYAKLLVSMAGKTSQIDELARGVGANAGHLRVVLEQWHKEGIISKNKPGRDYEIKLTNKGEAITVKLAELMVLDENWEEPKPEVPVDPLDPVGPEVKGWVKPVDPVDILDPVEKQEGGRKK